MLNICNIYAYIKRGYNYYNSNNRKRLFKLYILLVTIILLYNSSKLLNHATNIKGLAIIVGPFYIYFKHLKQYILKVFCYILNKNLTINKDYYF